MCIKFEGILSKEGRFWAVHVPTLEIYTQGKSKRDALAMIREAIELSVDQKGFKLAIDLLSQNHFILRSKEVQHDRYLIALMLKNQRAKYGLSTSQVATRLGISKNAYAQYEQARAVPSIGKVEEFIHAMSDRLHVVLEVLNESNAAA